MTQSPAVGADADSGDRPKNGPVPVIEVPAWPAPPDLVRELLTDVETEDGEQEPGVRPWDLAHLPEEAKVPVGQWLHDVAWWLNNTYAWQPDRVIPPCWPQHPPIATELAVVAFGRLIAYQTPTTAHPSRWHDDLQAFYQRMLLSLGADGGDCRAGRHQPWPAATDIAVYDVAPGTHHASTTPQDL